eukprot:Phypoly_transcript_15791.p1 GENE.Phypoly_transcript_15791~~Phypoly_transcript_15791.p1  ORF type:complete len:186 (+),score=21.90 Phypoly_transcript_15791:309-866(+)
MNGANVYGYIYLSQKEHEHLLECRAIKSAYCLFQEYAACEPETKASHPWKDVYDYYSEETARSIGKNPSDADVFSYLSLRHMPSIGKLDATASTRAIFFHITHFHSFQNLFKISVKINLTTLCTQKRGQLYNQVKSKEWEAVSLADHISNALGKLGTTQANLDNPLGCIVLPSGTIGWDNISFSS